MSNQRLFMVIYILAAPTLAGIAVTAALTMRMDSGMEILAAAAAGFAIAFPAALVLARSLTASRR